MEQVELAKQDCKDPIVLIEQRLDYSAYVPEGFGTGDLLIVADKTLTVIDLKYGKGVAVDAEWNPQMMLYGLGALELFDCIYDIETVRMTIYQPRLESVSTWEISVPDLMGWVEMELKPKAQLAIHETRGMAVSSEKITFRFPYTEDAAKVKAWTDLASAMVRQAKEQKRIDPEERIEENEKYYMRIWLLRIGFGGRDMKESRNTLMENLKGHSAFRTQADIDRAKVRTKQRAEAKKLAVQEARERAETAQKEETVAGLSLSETGSGEEKTEPGAAA